MQRLPEQLVLAELDQANKKTKNNCAQDRDKRVYHSMTVLAQVSPPPNTTMST